VTPICDAGLIRSRFGGFRLTNGDKNAERHPPPHNPLRGFLKLLVELDSSRFALSRVKAALLLIGLLVVFGLIGYALPAWLSRYF
jgi:hypothetical protein